MRLIQIKMRQEKRISLKRRGVGGLELDKQTKIFFEFVSIFSSKLLLEIRTCGMVAQEL